MSSPLEDVPIAELSQIVSNPFERPSPGFDDKHHGVDFAYYSRGNHRQMLGLPVFSIFNGRVAGVVLNSPPYGNSIIIESEINKFPPSIMMSLKQPVALTPYPYNSRLTCKELATADFTNVVGSIYTLYAHLENAPLLKVGDEVISGVQIGTVGNSGYSGNPHLHLEMRWGNSGQSFQSISYYDASATPEERSEYCAWRISGRFALMDPMTVLNSYLEFSSATIVP
jgi:murein DD-endopeptidase MepM/ murein hydrolase activator NlpD